MRPRRKSQRQTKDWFNKKKFPISLFFIYAFHTAVLGSSGTYIGGDEELNQEEQWVVL